MITRKKSLSWVSLLLMETIWLRVPTLQEDGVVKKWLIFFVCRFESVLKKKNSVLLAQSYMSSLYFLSKIICGLLDFEQYSLQNSHLIRWITSLKLSQFFGIIKLGENISQISVGICGLLCYIMSLESNSLTIFWQSDLVFIIEIEYLCSFLKLKCDN